MTFVKREDIKRKECIKCKTDAYVSIESTRKDSNHIRYRVICLNCNRKTEWFYRSIQAILSWNNESRELITEQENNIQDSGK